VMLTRDRGPSIPTVRAPEDTYAASETRATS
jgi:hypothetical protein